MTDLGKLAKAAFIAAVEDARSRGDTSMDAYGKAWDAAAKAVAREVEMIMVRDD